jgi:antitoxin HicB
MQSSAYAVRVKKEDGDHVVTVRDLPEVVTSGDTLDQSLELAADAIEVVVTARMERDQDLPEPTNARRGEHLVPLPAWLAAKASVYRAWKASGLKKTELARRMDRNEVEVRRILNPRHGTKLDQLEEAAKALGGRLSVSFETAA